LHSYSGSSGDVELAESLHKVKKKSLMKELGNKISGREMRWNMGSLATRELVCQCIGSSGRNMWTVYIIQLEVLIVLVVSQWNLLSIAGWIF
jgi:hypothetical protein